MENLRREFALQIVRQLTEAGFQALWAGGCVRDLLLGKVPKDYDVATTARPDQVREVFGRRRTLPVGESFGVIVVNGPKDAGQVEVATFRTEGPYVDGRRPEEVHFSTAEFDAHRRDFTINGMFYDPLTEQVLDYVGGQQDLRNRMLRAIGDPHERMTEDKLRMLRAVRFASNLNFALDPVTADAVREMAAQLKVVSAERITQEFRRMLAHPHRRHSLELCAELHLLPVFLPELNDLTPAGWETTLAILHGLGNAAFEPAMAVLLLGLTVETVEAICRRFRLSNEEAEQVAWLVGHQHALAGAPGFSLARLKRLLVQPHIPALLQLVRTRSAILGAPLTDVEFVEEFLRTHTPEQLNPPPLLTGNDLIRQGLTPGPQFKQLLDTIRDAQLNEEIFTVEEARALLKRLLEGG